MSVSCTNWDKESWLSSKKYFEDLTDILIRILKLNAKSTILDAGCGRAHLLDHISTKIEFDQFLTGVEPVFHKQKNNKKVKINNSNIQNFLSKNKKKYDFIIFKQVMHLIPLIERKELYKLIKSSLSYQGKLVIIQMDKKQNFPTFPIMSQRLDESINKHEEIIKELNLNFYNIKKAKFLFKVEIKKDDYLKMIENKFISILSDLSNYEIEQGCSYIKHHYPSDIIFNDVLNIYIFS